MEIELWGKRNGIKCGINGNIFRVTLGTWRTSLGTPKSKLPPCINVS